MHSVTMKVIAPYVLKTEASLIFEHLPVISDESQTAMLSTEIAAFKSILEECSHQSHTLEQVVDTATKDFSTENPNLAMAVLGCAFGVFGGLVDDYGEQAAWMGGVLSVPGVLAVLRLVDGELEVQALENQLGD